MIVSNTNKPSALPAATPPVPPLTLFPPSTSLSSIGAPATAISDKKQLDNDVSSSSDDSGKPGALNSFESKYLDKKSKNGNDNNLGNEKEGKGEHLSDVIHRQSCDANPEKSSLRESTRNETANCRYALLPGGMFARTKDVFVESLRGGIGRVGDGCLAMVSA